MWTVAFRGEFYRKLEEFLFGTAPDENGCFLLANSFRTKERSVLLVTDAIRPNEDSWNYSSERSLEPNSSYVSRCAAAADVAGSSLLFVHTHPNPLHSSEFSMIDRHSNNRMFANLSGILPGRPLGSLVFSRKGICGVVFDKGNLSGVSKVKIVGNTLAVLPGIGFEKKPTAKPEARYDRQVRALGRQNQTILRNMAVTVVGAGGTGSPAAVQLARMGVKNLRLIDTDSVDETNLSRIYGSGDTDIGKLKVDVLKKHIQSFSKSRVDAVRGDVTNEGMREQLVDSDVIFACTDNITSRHILNEISSRYYIPLIDVGCRIHLSDGNTISQAIVKVQVVTPDSACLWCSGTLDGKLLLQEFMSEEEKAKLANEGYYDGTEKQPSIISLTTLAASMAVTKLLSLVGVSGDQYKSYTQIELQDGYMISEEREIKVGCVCRKNLGECN